MLKSEDFDKVRALLIDHRLWTEKKVYIDGGKWDYMNCIEYQSGNVVEFTAKDFVFSGEGICVYSENHQDMAYIPEKSLRRLLKEGKAECVFQIPHCGQVRNEWRIKDFGK